MYWIKKLVSALFLLSPMQLFCLFVGLFQVDKEAVPLVSDRDKNAN